MSANELGVSAIEVPTISRLPRRSVSRNVSNQLPFIAVPGDLHCKPLQLGTIALA